MKTIPCLVLTVLTCLLPHHARAGMAPPLASPGQTPQGLARSDWQGIRAAYEVGRHAFHAAENGHTARTPGQQWTTQFDARGFLTQPDGGSWAWGMELHRYGFAGNLTLAGEAPRTAAEGSRLVRTWDATLQEWYVNDARGLEHGFTLTSRPAGPESGGPLWIEMDLRGSLEARVAEGGQSVSFLNAQGSAALTYGGLMVWDADGAILPARMTATSSGGLRFEIEEAGARYPVTVDPVAQQAYLKPAAVGVSQAADTFGAAVAVSGETVVIGAPLENSGTTTIDSTPNESAPDAGAAYVFVRSGGTWTQQAYLKADNAGGGDQFGAAVAIAGDTVVIGAPREDSSSTGVNSTPNEGATDAGAAYVFARSGETWAQQAYLKTPNAGTTQAGDQFGGAVAVDGDTVVVGARLEDGTSGGVNESAADAGAAWVFVRSGTTWASQVRLKALLMGTTQVNDRFGISVGISGDTVVVGADGEDSGTTTINSVPDEAASGAGAAYVFVRSGTSWSQQAYLKAANAGSGDFFGISVAVSGDTVVAGAHFEDSGTTGVNSVPNEGGLNSGAAYIFTRSGTAWTQQAYLKPGNTGASDSFGVAVAVSGDTVVAGASAEDSGTTGIDSAPDESTGGAGAAYVFVRSGTSWTQRSYLKSSSTSAGDSFGAAVAASGATIIVGAFAEDSSTTGVDSTPNESAGDAGAAFVFTLPNPVLEFPAGTPVSEGATVPLGAVATGASGTPQTFTVRNLSAAELTGLALTVDGANAADFALAAPVSSTVPGGGAVTFTITFTPGGPDARVARLHFSVAGEPPQSVLLTGTGLSAAILGAVQLAYAKPGAIGTTQAGDEFGRAIAISGNTVVVGAPFENSSTAGVNSTPDEGANDAGAAYVFVRSGTTWTQQAYLKAGNAGPSDEFGIAVAISGDTIVVGARFEDSSTPGVNGTPNESAPNAGAAYVFTRSGTTWTQQAFLKASNPGANDNFGNPVAISGDTIVVGAPIEDSSTTGVNSTPNESAPAAGAAYVFTRSGTMWTQQAYLKAGNTGEDDLFGFPVSISGDTLVVGATGEDSSTTGVNSVPNELTARAGAAYVFVRSGTAWTQQAYLKASSSGQDDEFGFGAAIAGETIVIGAHRWGDFDDGAAFVFVRSGATWTQQASLQPSHISRFFGGSVGISGETIVVGAIGEGSSTTGVNGPPNAIAPFSGAAFVFARSGTAWTQSLFLKAGNTGGGDLFGSAVAVSGDTVVAGARLEGGGTTGINGLPAEGAGSSGAAYFFSHTARIEVEQPAGTPLADGISTTNFGGVLTGGSAARTFTLKSTGNLPVTAASFAFDGAHAGEFALTAAPLLPLAPGASTTFGVTFNPGAPGPRTAALHLTTTGSEANPFDLALTGLSVAPGDADGDGLTNLDEVNLHGTDPNLADTDGDLVNDGSEVALASIGFDPLADSSALRTLLRSNANGVDLFTADQVQALHVGPLLSRGANNSFKLTLGLKKSNDLTTFTPFPFLPAQTSVNASGDLEFLFTVPDNAAFFKVEVK